jgi:hypothetical protein
VAGTKMLDGSTMTPKQIKRARRRGHTVLEQPRHVPLWRRWWLTRWPAYLGIGVHHTTRAAHHLTVGQWQTAGWPALAATLSVTDHHPLHWAAAAGIAAAVPEVRTRYRAWRKKPRRRNRFVSDREAYLWAASLSCVAGFDTVVAVGGYTPAWWWPAAATAVFSAEWLWHRRRRRPTKFLKAWRRDVAPSKDFGHVQLRDVDITHDDDGHPVGTFALVVPRGSTATELVRGGDTLASHLSDEYPFLASRSVRITTAYRDNLRTARVQMVNTRRREQPLKWEDFTLDERTGLFLQGDTGHEPSPMTMWQMSGGSATAIVSGPGCGKGNVTYLLGVEALHSPLVLPIFMDGKGGRGIPDLDVEGVIYARTPGQWRVAWAAIMQMMALREAEDTLTGSSRFKPTPRRPVIMPIVDEWPQIHAAWPYMIGDAIRWTGQTRSTGGHAVFTLHKGDGDSWGDTKVRSNTYVLGQAWLGRAGDSGASATAVQGYEGVDLDRLPAGAAWGFVCQGGQGGFGKVTMARSLFLPTQQEIEEEHLVGYTSAKEAARQARFPDLPTDMQQIYDRCLEMIASGEADRVEVVEEARAEQATAGGETTMKIMIRGLLATNPNGLTPAELRTLTCRPDGDRYVNNVLAALRDDGTVTQAGERGIWKLKEYA